jgi:hypothetical protein
MSKVLISILYLVGLALIIGGLILIIQSVPGGTTTINQYGGRTTTPGNVPLFVISLIMLIVGAIPFVAAIVGAALNVLRIPHWPWFICLIIFSVIALPIYLFIGPSVRAHGTGQGPTTPTYQV